MIIKKSCFSQYVNKKFIGLPLKHGLAVTFFFTGTFFRIHLLHHINSFQFTLTFKTKFNSLCIRYCIVIQVAKSYLRPIYMLQDLTDSTFNEFDICGTELQTIGK